MAMPSPLHLSSSPHWPFWSHLLVSAIPNAWRWMNHPSSTWLSSQSSASISSLNLRQHVHGNLRFSTFMNEIMMFRVQAPLLGVTGSPSRLMASHVLYFEAIAISHKYVSSAMIHIINHVNARFNERVWSLVSNHHPHHLNIVFTSDMEFKKGLTEFNVKPSFYVGRMFIAPYWDQCLDSVVMSSVPQAHQHQASIINIIFGDSRQLKCSQDQALISLIVIKYGSRAFRFRCSSLSFASLSSEASNW